ncbi:MAG: cell division protein ZapA [Bacteroidetes bacterium]|nr:MAG: cell division protein ZapA [Bacteroidota bacterium]
MSELTISLHIADRPYKLVIAPEHEKLFRHAIELIEKRMRDYSGSYAYKDKQDLLAMVALEYATNYLQDEQMLSGRGETHELKLAKIDKLLAEYLER